MALSMFPLILGVLAIIGLSIRDPATEARFQVLIIQSFPGTAQPEMLRALHGVKQSAGWLGIVSIGGLLWSASVQQKLLSMPHLDAVIFASHRSAVSKLAVKMPGESRLPNCKLRSNWPRMCINRNRIFCLWFGS